MVSVYFWSYSVSLPAVLLFCLKSQLLNNKKPHGVKFDHFLISGCRFVSICERSVFNYV